MKREFIFLMVIFSLNGCIILKKNSIEGSYRYDRIYGVVYELKLDTNGTFSFSWLNGLNKGITKGTWKRVHQHLILDELEIISPKKVIVEEKQNVNIDSVFLEIVDRDGTPLAFTKLVLNDKQEVRTNIEGKATIPYVALEKIQIIYLNYKNLEWYVKNSASNQFLISINLEFDFHYSIKNTRILIRGNKLIMDGNSFSEEKKITLKRF